MERTTVTRDDLDTSIFERSPLLQKMIEVGKRRRRQEKLNWLWLRPVWFRLFVCPFRGHRWELGQTLDRFELWTGRIIERIEWHGCLDCRLYERVKSW